MKQFSGVLVIATLVIWALPSSAYETYSQNRDSTNCQACHGGFQVANYVSLHDSAAWGTDLMSGHNSMISSACGACHQSSFFPVQLDESTGAGGLSAMGCVGCHGREESAGQGSEIIGAGLRQHHFRAGVTVCSGCHSDSDPTSFTPVPENVLPPNYFTPDAAHPDKPTDPCNANGSESVFGPVGLDNDGNGIYDLEDPACMTQPPTETSAPETPTSTPTASPIATSTSTSMRTLTETPGPPTCTGDCNGDGEVTVNELVLMVNIALGTTAVSECPAGDANDDGEITVDELVAAVNNALNGCPVS